MQQLLSFSAERLTLLSMKKLYRVKWSPEGSIRRRQETDTVYLFECYLQDCEG